MPKVLVSTVPFAFQDCRPVNLLDLAGIEYVVNPIGRKLTEHELGEMIEDYDALIAGTEQISERVISRAKKLKLISRVGVGLDNVDLIAAERAGVKVCYTANAPAPAVAELTIGLMLSLLRFVHVANIQLHNGDWHRHFGRRLSEVVIGVIGAGRIGKLVLQMLSDLNAGRVLVNDIDPKVAHSLGDKYELVSKEEIYRQADIITLHVPLTNQTSGLIAANQLLSMKQGTFIVNTARGGIVAENDLFNALASGHLGGAGIDVFEQEPYKGPLSSLDNCLLTAHMGSMSVDCRTRMEIEATDDVVRFFAGDMLRGLVPFEEYEIQRNKRC